ncbi:protein phosphatase 2C domain-containing protein [Actinosynnema sp. NPDC002837]
MDLRTSEQSDRGHAWHLEQPPLIVTAVWAEKKPDQGEDAEPLFVHRVSSRAGILAVFDGAGGAGASSAGRPDDGPERTSAWVGSRFVRALVEQWFVREVADGTGAGESLHEHLAAELTRLRGTAKRKMRSSMQREFPTTMAGLRYRLGDDSVSWEALWAGDSRAFLLDVSTGLHQLSRDDTVSDDALVLLNEDPPMTNMISADRRFDLNSATGEADLPCVLVCATDGFFGYVTTPAECEHVLLDTLERSETAGDWGNALIEDIAGYTGDDASLVVLAVGFEDFASVKDHYRSRTRELRTQHIELINALDSRDREQVVRAREDSWARYRAGYERLMPLRREGKGA